jgi:hypothetical protein
VKLPLLPMRRCFAFTIQGLTPITDSRADPDQASSADKVV